MSSSAISTGGGVGEGGTRAPLLGRDYDHEDLDDEDDVGGGGHPTTTTTSATRLSQHRVVEQRQGKPAQNMIVLFHFLFKVVAILVYLCNELIGLGYIATFVFVLILLSMDFWLVKNLSGRLLAGLRWWSVIDERDAGKMVWKFEAWSPRERQVAYRTQVNMFWAGLWAQQSLWSLLLFSTLFRLKLGWLIITVIACTLNGANLYGYIRCRLQQPGDDDGSGQGGGWMAWMRDRVIGLFVSSSAAATTEYSMGQAAAGSGRDF